MKNRKRVIGVLLLLCLPLFVLAAGFYSYSAPRWYFSVAILEPGAVSFPDLNHAFQLVAPGSPDVTLEKISGADLVAIKVRDANDQAASDKANSISLSLQQKLQERGAPRVVVPAEPSHFSNGPSVPASLIVAAILGLFPAIVGLILVVIGRRTQLPTSEAVAT